MKKKSVSKKSTWGGARSGAGRKAVDDKRLKITITADPDILEMIDRYAEQEEIKRSIAIERLCIIGLKKKKFYEK